MTTQDISRIVAEMRRFKRYNTGDANTDIKQWADRLEAIAECYELQEHATIRDQFAGKSLYLEGN